jgi:hypothetical protein
MVCRDSFATFLSEKVGGVGTENQTPAKRLGAGNPAAINESAAVVDELHPALCRQVARWADRIKTSEPFRPSPRCTAFILSHGGTFSFNLRPHIVLWRWRWL